jgi:hypothetical protein
MPQEKGTEEPATSTQNKPDRPEFGKAPGPNETQVVPSSRPADHEQHRTENNGPKWTDIVMALFTVCLVGVAIWQGFVFSRQLEEMHSGGVDTHALAEAAKSQADASKAQADSTKAQVDKMGESLQKTDALIAEAKVQADSTKTLAENTKMSTQLAERAWVGVQTVVLSTYQVDKEIRVTINFLNTGHSPALKMNYSGRIQRLHKGETPVFLWDWEINDWSSAVPLAPQGAYQMTLADKLTSKAFTTSHALRENEKTLIDKQDTVVWAWGTTRYKDIFNEAHVTRFCANTLDPTSKAPISEGEQMKSCSEYSDMN